MNKEAIERTKARVKKSIKNSPPVIFSHGFHIDQIKVINPNTWEPLTPKQHLLVAVIILSIIGLVLWWAQ